MSAAVRKAKRPSRPVYAEVVRVAVLATGEERLALVATHPVDRRLMKERGYREGDEVRLEIKKPRNAKFNRLAHALGKLMVDSIDEFATLDSHGALKRLQRESGICCEEQSVEVPGGGTLALKVAQSIAFDEMSEEEFSHLFKGICHHIVQKYWHDMSAEQVEQMVLMTEGS